MKKVFLFLILNIFISCALAETLQRGKLWLGGDLDGQIAASRYWRYNMFVQSRFGDEDSKFEQFILRPSVYYRAKKGLSFWLGYDFIPTVPGNSTSALLEQRVWQQIQYSKDLNSLHTLSFRTRLEERWLQGSSQIAPRLRERVEYTFNGFIKPNIALDIFDEIFLTLRNADWVAPQTINQNRIFIGFGIPVNEHSAIDIGYMNIYRPRSNQNEMDHAIVCALSLDAEQVKISPLLAI